MAKAAKSSPTKVTGNFGDANSSELTKTEYAMVQFIAAHLTAHGKYPDPNQIAALIDLAKYSIFRANLNPDVQSGDENNDPE
jgi:hypothetical protein